MYSETINLEINGIEFDAEVEFNFYKGKESVTYLAPEDCCEGSPDEYEILELYILAEENGLSVPLCISPIIELLKETIVEQLEVLQ